MCATPHTLSCETPAPVKVNQTAYIYIMSAYIHILSATNNHPTTDATAMRSSLAAGIVSDQTDNHRCRKTWVGARARHARWAREHDTRNGRGNLCTTIAVVVIVVVPVLQHTGACVDAVVSVRLVSVEAKLSAGAPAQKFRAADALGALDSQRGARLPLSLSLYMDRRGPTMWATRRACVRARVCRSDVVDTTSGDASTQRDACMSSNMRTNASSGGWRFEIPCNKPPNQPKKISTPSLSGKWPTRRCPQIRVTRRRPLAA